MRTGKTSTILCLIAGVVVSLAGGQRVIAQESDPPSITSDQRDFFERKIRPVLAGHCWDCHGPDTAEAELRLDSIAAMLEGGERGPVVVPGQPEKSLLIQAVNHADTLQMPPKTKLPLAVIVDLTSWVKNGAVWPDSPRLESQAPRLRASDKPVEFSEEQRNYWSFQPLGSPLPPRVDDREWPNTPVDNFVLAQRESHQFATASRADERTFVRRATFDLLGIPPDFEEVEDFQSESQPDKVERLMDRLLASPRYGERWGRHWLDVARYGDSNGLDENLAFANAYRYRDYVIAAMNRDKPYDQFVREQIAGDILANESSTKDPLDALVASGFLVIGAKMLAEDDPVKMQMDIVDEQIDTIGKAFMGLTIGCARCHDHKFDPFPTTDYYSLAGIFKSTKTMENFSVVARWQERPLAVGDERLQVDRHVEHIASVQKATDLAVSQANDRLLSEARTDLKSYLLAASRQIWLDSISQPIAANYEKLPLETRPETRNLIEAESFQRGNALKLSTGYGEGIGVILSDGGGGWTAEFDVNVPVAGIYQLETRYAAAESRPVEISINGKVVKSDGLQTVTGSWNPDTQRWNVEGQYSMLAGSNVVKLFRTGPFPHIDKLFFAHVDVSDNPLAEVDFGIAIQHLPRLKAAFVTSWKQYLLRLATTPQAGLSDWAVRLEAVQGAKALPTVEAGRALAHLAAETADRLAQAEAAWQASLAAGGPPPTSLPDADQESLRKVLYSKDGPFAIPKNAEEYYTDEDRQRVTDLRVELKQLQDSKPKFPEAMVASDGSAEDLPVHLRGNHTTLGRDRVPRRFPRILAGDRQPAIGSDRSGRREFAEWLTTDHHPLTGRVIVNRIWQWHFGEGLVRSPDNFGLLGEKPTHPELLDWLARRLIARGWSMKALHRDLMNSSTYQMSSAATAAAMERDPENRLWWRFNRRRLEAESIRDSVLFVGEALELKMGGSLLPTENRQYVTSTANVNPQIYNSLRRTIYLPVVRSALYEVLQAFDFAEPTVMMGKRDNTTVAPQALFMLNSSLVSERAKELAVRLTQTTDRDDGERIQWAFRRILSRRATADEVARALEFLDRFQQSAAKVEVAAGSDMTRVRAWQGLCRALIASNEFVYVD